MAKRLLGFLRPAATAAGPNGTRADPPQPDAIADAQAQARGQVYISDLPADLEPARRLLQKYSGIPARDIDKHVHAIVCISLMVV